MTVTLAFNELNLWEFSLRFGIIHLVHVQNFLLPRAHTCVRIRRYGMLVFRKISCTFLMKWSNLMQNRRTSRSSRLQMFFKIVFLNNFACFTGKNLCIVRKGVPVPPPFKAPTLWPRLPLFKIFVSPLSLFFVPSPFNDILDSSPHPHANPSCPNLTNQTFLVETNIKR